MCEHNDAAHLSGAGSGGLLNLNWTTIPGQNYKVQWSADMWNWTTVPGSIPAAPGWITSWQTKLEGWAAFYRVLMQ
jgi:hypothetical protein